VRRRTTAHHGGVKRLGVCEPDPWAELLCQVFATVVFSCPCGDRRSVTAIVVDSAMVRAMLAALGLPWTLATFAPARDPPQAEL
jgi:hypothetical protein